jgi:hypothetical protein
MTLQPELRFVTHRNHYLFSDYYLTHRVAERQEWQELDARPHLDALRQLWAERRAALVNANEQQTETDWIRPVLNLLGHHFAPQVSLSTPQGAKTPDYILCPDEPVRTAVQTLGRPAVEADLAVALAVADAKAWDRLLDRSLPGAGVRTLHQHPGLQIDFYIRHSGLAWGVLTNGRLWQLFHQDTSKKLDVYYEVDLPALLEADDAEAFKYFWLFFRRQAFQPGSAAPGAPAWLELVLAESAAYQQGISESLKEQVYEALHSLAQGLLDFPGNDLSPDPASLQAIYDHSLLLLYRLLFILYAEDRELLPVRENTAYRESYSLHALKRRIAREIDAGQPLHGRHRAPGQRDPGRRARVRAHLPGDGAQEHRAGAAAGRPVDRAPFWAGHRRRPVAGAGHLRVARRLRPARLGGAPRPGPADRGRATLPALGAGVPRGLLRPPRPAALRELQQTYREYTPRIRHLNAEAEQLERRLSDLVNETYGLTPEEIALLWATAPPRMPIHPRGE